MRAFIARAGEDLSPAREHVVLWAGTWAEVAALERPRRAVIAEDGGVGLVNGLLRARKCHGLLSAVSRFGTPLRPSAGAGELGGTFSPKDALRLCTQGSRRALAEEASGGVGSARRAIAEFDAFADDGLAACPPDAVVVAEPLSRWLRVRDTLRAWLSSKKALHRAMASSGDEREAALAGCACVLRRFWGDDATSDGCGPDAAERRLSFALAHDVGELVDGECEIDVGLHGDGVGGLAAVTPEAAVLLSVLGAPGLVCRVCEQCGSPFFTARARSKRFCTPACSHAHRAGAPMADDEGAKLDDVKEGEE